MTTITNFIYSSFIDNMDIKDSQISQNPIWVLNTQNNSGFINQTAIKNHIINHAVESMKPLLHIDLGISLIKKYPSVQFKNVELQNGLRISQPFENKPYFIVRTPISLRVGGSFLSNLVKQVNTLNDSKILKTLLSASNIAKKYQNKFSLFVQGIESMLLLNNKDKEIQSFISQLSNLHPSIKQISIFTQEKLISKQLMFSLQRISTCLTTLTSYNNLQNTWQCTSTVRRYTGYSNEEVYMMTLNKVSKKIKVTKKLNIISTEQTKEQKEMVDSLGFVVKKGESDKLNEEELKKMIYPHLRMQQQTECCGGKCERNSCCQGNTQNRDQGLIILDDEQQDEDDVDV